MDTPLSFKRSVTVDGYIGVGKSTLLRNLGSITKSWLHPYQICFYEENVISWENFYGINLLEKMYESMGTQDSPWTTRLQTKIIKDVMAQDLCIRSNLPRQLSIQERDLNTIKKVFLPIHCKSMNKLDYHILHELVDLGIELNSSVNSKLKVFLSADKMTCYNRMKSRKRNAEQMISPHDYSQICDAMDILKSEAAIVLDTDQLNSTQVSIRMNQLLLTALRNDRAH